MENTAAFVATARFGLGARPGEMKAAAGDPRGWLAEQLLDDRMPKEVINILPSFVPIVAREKAYKQGKMAAQAINKEQKKLYLHEAAARTRAQINSQVSFRERLVAFWSNHFTVSIRQKKIRGAVGAFECEAIRPHITGRFRDILGAVTAHPVMLTYLDNVASIGPNSAYGLRRNRGLNENLARELLELHTLGVDGGYGQGDVRALAGMLTGWSYASVSKAARSIGKPHAGTSHFDEGMHEPGSKTLLGKTYKWEGKREVDSALDTLSTHPATAHHIATKLARHFIADQPPLAVVARLYNIFLDSGGDLGVVTHALIDSPEAWAEPLTKIKSANEFIVSALRGLNIDITDKNLIKSLDFLAQMPFSAPSPAGWPDTADGWIGSEALMRRTDWAVFIAKSAREAVPLDLLNDTLGPVADTNLRSAVQRAPSTTEAVAMIIASPAFQRR